jgi:ATP-dependent helicase/nuclease subunit B
MQLEEVPFANLLNVAPDHRLETETASDRPLQDGIRRRTERPGNVEHTHHASMNGDERTWTDLGRSRTPRTSAIFHGATGPRARRPWSVSALETHLTCPFKFFAQHVLKLDEDPDDEEVMDPRRQGLFVHGVFESFFDEWQAAGNRAITSQNLASARTLFAEVVDRLLRQLPEGEAELERTRLLGSPVAAGLGEAVFRMEAERSTPVVERLLEHKLTGRFEIRTASGRKAIELRGKADRLDLLADGTFRLIDYKLGWPPDRNRALQLPIYSICAEQRLEGRDGRQWHLAEAVYLAFKGPKRVVPLFGSPEGRDEVLLKAQQRLADTIEAIDRGEFPPAPDDVFRCETCSFASVCRKDYVGTV